MNFFERQRELAEKATNLPCTLDESDMWGKCYLNLKHGQGVFSQKNKNDIEYIVFAANNMSKVCELLERALEVTRNCICEDYGDFLEQALTELEKLK